MAIELGSLKKGMNVKAPRLIVFGEEKIGKSTLGSQAPDPIFMNVEDGADYLNITRAFQKDGSVKSAAEATYQDCCDIVSALLYQPHDFKTLVVDTMDALEMKIIKGMLEEYNTVSLSDPKVKEFAYGGAHNMLASRVKFLLDGFDMLREQRNMCIIVIVHSKVERVDDDPMDDAHLRHVFRLSGKVDGLVKDWADCIVLARQNLYIKQEDAGFGQKISKAIDGERFLCGGKSHAYSGGGRVTLPDRMPLSWEGFIEAFNTALQNQQNNN